MDRYTVRYQGPAALIGLLMQKITEAGGSMEQAPERPMERRDGMGATEVVLYGFLVQVSYDLLREVIDEFHDRWKMTKVEAERDD